MEAGLLRCPSCGANATPDAHRCSFCKAELATVACPRCFGRIFVGDRHCAHCGAGTQVAPILDGKPRTCPRCQQALSARRLGDVAVGLCAACAGLWVDVASFEVICAEAERHAPLLGSAPAQAAPPVPVKYVPCPECRQLMNRTIFAKVSKIVVDVCKPHGIWFDRDELRGVVEFIRRGGLLEAHQREAEEVRSERRRLVQEEMGHGSAGGWMEPVGTRSLGNVAVGEFLGWLLR